MHPRALQPLLVLAAVPLLLAPVRLKDASPPQLQHMGNRPAPQSYSLPAAEALTVPTVIRVSPSGIDTPPPPASLPPTPAGPPPPSRHTSLTPDSRMSVLASQLCQRALAATAQLTLLSFESEQNQRTAALTVAASAAAAQAAARHWPSMETFEKTSKRLSWGTPYTAEITTTAKAALKLCANPNETVGSHGIGHSQIPIPRPH